jgi:predicted transcriptional regulator
MVWVIRTEDMCEVASVGSEESFLPRRIKLDLIALILTLGDIHNDDNNNNNNNNNATKLGDEFKSFQEKVKEMSSESDVIEDYLSLLQRRGFIEYDYRGNNKTYRTTPRGKFVLQLYQRAAMWLH